MIIKDKVKELIDVYYPLQDQDAEWAMRNNARLCALICVEQIISELEQLDMYEHVPQSLMKDWHDVKFELQKEI